MYIQGMFKTIVPICTNIVQLLEDNAHFQMHVTKSFTFMLFNRQLQCWVVATINNLSVEIHVKETFERLGFNVNLGCKNTPPCMWQLEDLIDHLQLFGLIPKARFQYDLLLVPLDWHGMVGHE
jgi:hypothetical protein